MDLTTLRKQMEEIAGAWNGDESGLQEDRAMAAKDILEALDEIESNLEYLKEN